MAEPRVNRKLAAILSADVVGYSKLMADNEAATVATLKQYRAAVGHVIERHKGRIVNAPGDNILAEFASAVEAVQAAVEIQRSIEGRNVELPDDRRMHLRVGLNLGDVIEEDDGTIYGDGVNIAARMEALAEEGGICISSTIHDAVEGKLDFGFDFLGERPVKNIAKPVRVYRVRGEPGDKPKKPTAGRRNKLAMVAATGVLLVAIAGVSIWQLGREPASGETGNAAATRDPVLALPTGPSIAVLPFENLSDDSKQDFFADGISEDILTQLSHFDGIKVIARNSTFQFKGQSLGVREIGRRLGVQYVLEGSIRRGGNQLRITAQLLDARDGSQVWSKTYDRDVDVVAVFEIQDEITSEIAGILAGTTGVIAKSEIASIKRKSPDNLDSYECVLLGHLYQQLWEEKSHLTARDCLTRTVKDDPTFADAWAWLAFLYLEEAIWSFNAVAGGPDALTRAEVAAKRALDEDRRNQRARLVLAGIYFARRDSAGFVSEAEQALALNPNNADALGEMGWRYAYSVDWARGLAMMEKAMVLNPLHPAWYHIASFYDAYGRSRYEKALQAARKAETPGNYLAYCNLAAVYGQLGRKAEAASAVDTLLKLYPDFQDHAREELEGFLHSNPEYVDRMLAGLQKAGLFKEREPGELSGFD
jgi:adenylate cyclase